MICTRITSDDIHITSEDITITILNSEDIKILLKKINSCNLDFGQLFFTTIVVVFVFMYRFGSNAPSCLPTHERDSPA